MSFAMDFEAVQPSSTGHSNCLQVFAQQASTQLHFAEVSMRVQVTTGVAGASSESAKSSACS